VHLNPLASGTPMYELALTDEDWAKLDGAQAEQMLFTLYGIRRFEEAVLLLDRQGLLHGPGHSSIGQDAGAAGCMTALPADALITGSHRAHHQVIAKLIQASWPDNFAAPAAEDLPETMQAEITAMLSEILGLRTGWSGGRGGSMHLRRDTLGVMGTNAIVAGGLPIGCGIAMAEKRRGTGRPVVAFFGDGAVHQGTTHEAMNLAALYDLPILFFLENNRYAVSMTIEQSTRETNLLTRAMAHGIPSVRVDGMDALAVRCACEWALEQMSDTGGGAVRGPVLVQADVYRYYHQSAPVVGSAFGYRTKEEEDAWRARDPVEGFGRACIERGLLSEEVVAHIDGLLSRGVENAVQACAEGKGSRRTLRAELWPDPATVDDGLTGDLSELSGARMAEPEDFAPEVMVETKFIEVMPAVMLARMRADEDILILGEDVANLGGGTVGATRGVVDAFPNRVINTPICENGFCGMAGGLASRGMRPVVELMYSDFLLVAADQLLNQIGKMRHLFGGRYPVPVVLRCRIPGAEGYGSQHSMDPSAVFMMYPGWRIVAPSTPFDYVGLMNSALRSDDPVLVLEHQSLHRTTGPVPEDLDYCIPIGKARIVEPGNQMTLLCTLTMVETSRQVAREMGIAAEIVDLRSLSLRDIDWPLIGESLARTNNVAIVEQSTRGTSIGGILAGEIQRRFFDHLDQPVRRVVGRWAPPTVSRVLETAALAGPDDIRRVLADMLAATAQRPARDPAPGPAP
jgi:2-oxoisovalerate dehydrogenase E1 component